MAREVSGKGLWAPLIALLGWLAIPFVILTGVTAFLVARYAFDASIFVSVIYAILCFLGTCAVVFSMSFLYRKADFDFFLRDRPGANLAQRRKASQEALVAMRRESVLAQARKNRRTFYQNAFMVGIGLTVLAVVAKEAFGRFPQEVFLVPFPALIAIWLLLLLLLPRVLLIVLAIALTGIWLAVTAVGPTVALFILPYLFTFPLLMIMNFLILFGPLAAFNIMQIKIIKPGEATWGISLDDVRGQEEAKKQILTTLRISVSAEGEKLVALGGRAERGTLLVGPPGTGKTLIAKGIATFLNSPIVVTTGSAFMATFIGIDVIAMIYLRFRTEALAKEFGRAVVFIDEAELLLQRRAGMQAAQGAGMRNAKLADMWRLFDYDESGCISNCGLMFDNDSSREAFWEKKFRKPSYAPQMMPMFPGMGGGAGMAIFPFLVWLDGMDSPPLLSRMFRSKINELLDILLVVPPFIERGGKPKYLRLPPAKPPVYNIYFFAATNRPQMIDPAMRRPGRFGKTVVFNTPGEREREEIADLYLSKVAHDPRLDSTAKRQEFARVTVGLSPAEIEQVVRDAVNFRHDEVEMLREVKGMVEAGEMLDQQTQKFWDKHRHSLEEKDWDTVWVTWEALMEALSSVRHGQAKPTRTTERNRERTAYHEFAGHLLPLKYFCVEWQRPIMLSIMPRGEALGMVGHVPVEEHDPQPQRILEGLLRVSVGSIVAERLYFEDNEPGVSSDLENATRIACAMIGLYGMVPRKCSEEERKRYASIGESILSIADVHHSMMGEGGFVTGALGAPDKRRAVTVLLGQGFVDVYRLLKKNQHLSQPVVQQLLDKDELVGQDLETLWETMDLEPLMPEDHKIWPDREIEPINPFYRTEATVIAPPTAVPPALDDRE